MEEDEQNNGDLSLSTLRPMEVDLQQEQLPEKLPETSEIKRLDDDTVRRITAEQAISDLASIVKELIDNALDAESTTIKSEYLFMLLYTYHKIKLQKIRCIFRFLFLLSNWFL